MSILVAGGAGYIGSHTCVELLNAGDIAVSYCDASKAYNELGWKAEKTLEDMCADSWKWQSNNPNGYGE